MSFHLPTSAQGLSPYLSKNTIGVGITQLPKRNLFQSIGDYFAEKSGNKRISFVIVDEAGIKILHFRGESLIENWEISFDKINQLSATKSSTDDGVISTINCQLDEIISTDKNGVHKTKSHSIVILPCYFGFNLTQLNSPTDIQWANDNREKISQFLKEKSK
ncbi:hypothetical protein V7S79_09400 [Aquirufa sp. ROCK-SH2]